MYLPVSFSNRRELVLWIQIIYTKWFDYLYKHWKRNEPIVLHPEKPLYQRVNIAKIRIKLDSAIAGDP
jgi:hypothetical protein